MTVIIPLRTGRGQNDREHHMTRARRIKAEHDTVLWALKAAKATPPTLPCIVTLTRLAPSRGLDSHDNLPASLKACVDALAQWIGVDDRHSEIVEYKYKQERAKEWGVMVEFDSR